MGKLNLVNNTFTANGVKYKMNKRLPLGYFIEFEKLQSEIGFGFSFKQMFNKLKDTYEDLNKGKLADASVKVHNMMTGVAKNVDGRAHPLMMMCALFISEEGEERKFYKEEIMLKKINDWTAEGLDANDFFQLAFNLVEDFIPIFKKISQSTSKKEPEKKTTSGKSK